MSLIKNRSLHLILGCLAGLTLVNCQIHRAASQSSSQSIKIDLNQNFQWSNNFNSEQQNLSANETNSRVFDEGFFVKNSKSLTWAMSIIGALLVGLSGILPVAVLPHLADNHQKLMNSVSFKCLVSFAAGGLLGDIFIHLFPETYAPIVLKNHSERIYYGLWSIGGLFAFFTIEKIFPDDDDEEEVDNKKMEEIDTKKPQKTNQINTKKSFVFLHTIKTVGLLNLFANVIDNFTHGIAVAGGFQASFKFGLMTLLATLLHEIPHEIGDFAILLKSGLNYKQAAFAQLITACSGMIGAIFALAYSTAEKAGDATSWILPFTSGGFLYISLVGIIPDILNEKDWRVSIKQIVSLESGVFVIYYFSHLFE